MTYVFKVEARSRFLALAGRLANDDKPTAVEPAASGKPATKLATKSATSTIKLMRFDPDESDADDEHDRTPALQEAARQRVLRLAGMLDPPAAGDAPPRLRGPRAPRGQAHAARLEEAREYPVVVSPAAR